MEEIQIRDALRQHVTENEPPMGLSAAHLLVKGRRRHWWRMGVASGGTVAAITMIATIALVPTGGAGPSLDSACGLPVVTNYVPQPSTEPDRPTPYPTYNPTPDPSNYPTPDATSYPTPDATSYQTPDATGYPSVMPTGDPMPEPTLDPSHPPDQPRIREMECYLRRELQRMVPDAKFAQSNVLGPLEVYSVADPRWENRHTITTYVTTAFIIGRDQTVQFEVSVQRSPVPPTEPNWGWSFEKRGDLVICQLRRGDGLLMSEVYTPHSVIAIYSTGTLLSLEQLVELSSATEMDMFR